MNTNFGRHALVAAVVPLWAVAALAQSIPSPRVKNDGATKKVDHRFRGRRPIFAFGNSDGDQQIAGMDRG